MNIGGVAERKHFLFTDSSDTEAWKSRFHSSISGFIKGHQSCASLSPLPFILLEMWLPHCMLLFNLPLSLSLSVSLYPRSPSVLLCEVTCESDQLNPDHQLCLTYFRFGTLGFLAFAFVYMGLAWTHSARMRFDLPGLDTNVSIEPFTHFKQPCFIFIHVKALSVLYVPCSVVNFSSAHWTQTGNLPVTVPLL